MCFTSIVTAQIGIGTTNPNSSAVLDIVSSNTGVLFPRVSDSTAVVNPAAGLMIYDVSDACMRYYNGIKWSDCMGGIIPPIFLCGDVLVDSRDGKSYNTVQIGTQCWMAENLNVGTRIDGVNNQTDNGIIEKYCFNNNETPRCDLDGALYQWNEMMQYSTVEGSQGICPTGWHLPTDLEWCELENFADTGPIISCNATLWRGTDVDKHLKVGWGGGDNSTGFSAIAGGERIGGGSFQNIFGKAYFWTSTESGGGAWERILRGGAQSFRFATGKDKGFNCRCVLD